MNFSDYVSQLKRLYAEANQELDLEPPADDAALAQSEQSLGPLDPKLRAAWAEANGAGEYSPFFARPGFVTPYDFISIEDATYEQSELQNCADTYEGCEEPEPRDSRIAPGWFLPGWTPFAQFGGGSLLLLSDMAPSPTGQAGQIIRFVHDPDEIVYIAQDFDAFLAASIEMIEQCASEFLEEM